MISISDRRIPFDQYIKISAVNWSTLKEMRRSPLHYRYLLENGRDDTLTLAKGRAAHTAIFDPDRFLLEYACFKGPIRRGKKWDAFKSSNDGATILKVDEYKTCLSIRDAVRSHRRAAELLSSGEAEKSITWTDSETGIACKARLDWLNLALIDLKTSKDVESRRFGNIAAKFGYHGQLAMYRDGVTAITGTVPPVFVIAVESGPPHDVAVYRLGDDELYAGYELYSDLLKKLAECRRTNHWPGRYPDEEMLDLPRYVFDDEDQEDGTAIVIASQEDNA